MKRIDNDPRVYLIEGAKGIETTDIAAAWILHTVKTGLLIYHWNEQKLWPIKQAILEVLSR